MVVIKQFVRFAIVATLWKRYKFGIVSVLGLLAFWFMVSFFHGEYISYAEATGERQYLALSFFIKWGLGLGALLLFVLLHLGWLGKSAKSAEQTAEQAQTPKSSFDKVKDKARESVSEFAATSNPEPQVPPAPKPGDENYDSSQDPFASLRDKPKLRSRGDVELDKQGKS